METGTEMSSTLGKQVCFLVPPVGGFLLLVNGAGHRHGAPILGNDGQVGRSVVLWDKVLGLVILVGVGGVVSDPAADVVCKVVRGHVVY